MAVLACDGVVLGDLSVPCEIFARARDAAGRSLYDVRVCGPTPEVKSKHVTLRVPRTLRWLARAHTVIVPGVEEDVPLAGSLLRALSRAAARGARVASICSGAFVLGQAGLLDGRRVTTHWLAADTLARRHPSARVDPNVLYVDEGDLLTSAGALAAADLCLHMVRVDHGAEIAAAVARASVMPLERDGGQAQFITHAAPAPEDGLAALLAWLESHLERDLDLAAMARQARMSERTFSRRFREQTGTTPARWLVRARLRHAQRLLETTTRSVEEVAEACGFGSATVLRGHFRAQLATTPTAYRRAFA